ncbi:CRISPR-associated endonuclease Cas3'' [Synechococcus sp. J7-Johnson]|uniref:CRISPR-associated endonuclease Cas3'' n=1 Tax=Synechococcus sp. J7-Johnson TaxID=2823737 RepID=UPI0020CCFB6D|nr:CRISPR-associated endonuclease Cas3'' [Synechococcus sp. J7-Johnson]MCP9841743.1 CRISPR-associated endonuclease Cas3'' [Synechococcus sp. J7-Johnson]
MTLACTALWAKSLPSPDEYAPGGEESRFTPGYSLAHHLLDVAAVAHELVSIIPCPVESPCSIEWAAILVGCHDLGKATPGFQEKWEPGREHGFTAGFDYPPGAPDRHDASTVPLLTDRLARLGVARRTASALAQAVGAHHGNLIPPTELQAAGRWRFTPTWCKAHDELFHIVRTSAAATGLPSLSADAPTRTAQLAWLMGLTTVADWIGSSDALCRPVRLAGAPPPDATWFKQSRMLARTALVEVGLTEQSI